MDNGKWIMDNEGVAFGDIFKIISEGNTTIIHYSLSIIHSCVSTINGNLMRLSSALYNEETLSIRRGFSLFYFFIPEGAAEAEAVKKHHNDHIDNQASAQNQTQLPQ